MIGRLIPSALRDDVRRIGWRFAPRVMAERSWRYRMRLRERLAITSAAREWVAQRGDTVEAGPFAGLRYPVELLVNADAPVAKMRGTYERELTEVIEELVIALRNGGTFVNVGCSDGWYAAGVARAASHANVEAYDASASAREATRALVRANGGNVQVRGAASPRALLATAADARAVLCDIDGAEVDVLTEDVVASFAHALVVVELHDDIAPGTELTMLARLRRAHDVELIVQREHESDDEEPGASEMRTHRTPWAVARPRR